MLNFRYTQTIYNKLFLLLSAGILWFSYMIYFGKIVFKIDIMRIGSAISISLQTTKSGAIFTLLIGLLYFTSFIYSWGYNKEYHNSAKNRFNFLYCFSAILAMCIALSANLFTMFIFYETLTLATYPLICFTKTQVSVKAAKKYLMYLMVPSLLLLLPSMMFIYHKCGNLDFVSGGILSGSGLTNVQTEILFLCVVYGIAKSAIFPLYKWLPTAMIASAPVSGLLHAVAVVKSGIFMLLAVTYKIFGSARLAKCLECFFGVNWLVLVGMLGAIIGSLVAFRQSEIKARLAYSTIAHLSLMIAMIGLLNEDMYYLILFYMFGHGVAKILLFYANGVIQKYTHQTQVVAISGLGQSCRTGFVFFFIGIIFMLGMPGSAIFHAKHSIIHILHDNSAHEIIATIFFVSIAGTLYLGKVVYNAFFRPMAGEELALHHKVDAKIILSLGMIVVINLISYIKLI